jgi:molybdopterin-guanine dinucleotide biosynthesis protein A
MLGVVMAGGEARRLGEDKARVLIDGEPLWQRQQRVLREAGARHVVIIRRPGQWMVNDVECWRDGHAGVGPLAGLHAALAPQAAEHVMVLAVDMPGITAKWFQWLQRYCRPGAGAMVQHAEACEPLAAIYPRAALGEVTERLQRGELSLQRLAHALAEKGQLGLVPVGSDERAILRGINTPDDLAFWQSSEGRSSLASDERHGVADAKNRPQAGSYHGAFSFFHDSV